MAQKTYLNILKSGIYLSFLMVFIVASKLLFPFITGKQIFFNILIEILFVFWVSYLIKYPSGRPKLSLICYGLISYFSVILLSCFFSVDFNLSFWGDIERMLGFFHLAHYLIFYFIIITVFRDQRDWFHVLLLSSATAIFISLHSLLKIHYSTIGNTAYVSGYIIFNVFFASIAYFYWRNLSEKNKSNWAMLSFYIISVLTMIAVLKSTNTRGAYVAFAVSFMILATLIIFLGKNKKLKQYFIASSVVFVLLVTSIFVYADKPFVKNMPMFVTITQITPSAVTFQTRLISWKAALKDFPNHPILGTGLGNFAITFDKYFDPSFYRYTASETYFDRAHNNLVDIASTTGSLGLITYLSIFVAVFYLLIKGYRKKEIGLADFVLLVSLIAAYFVQNLVVFDSQVTYLMLMIMLGYVYWLSHQEKKEQNNFAPLDNKEIFSIFIVGLMIFIIIFQYNLKPWQMMRGAIDGQYAFADQDLKGGVEIYKKALDQNTVLDRDSRDSLVKILIPAASALNKISREDAREILDYTIALAEKNVRYNPKDSMTQMQLAQILNLASVFYRDEGDEKGDMDKFYFYSDRALEAINKSIESSPGRTRIYFMKAQIYVSRDEKDNVLDTINYAINMDQEYAEGYCRLSRLDLFYQDEEAAFDNMDKCLDLGGLMFLNDSNVVKFMINHYAQSKDFPKLVSLYEKLVSEEDTNSTYFINLARIYVQIGETEKAIQAVEKAVTLDPSLKESADKFIGQLNGGNN